MKKILTTALFAAMTISTPALGFDYSEGNASERWQTVKDAYTLDAPGTAQMLRDYIEACPASLHTTEARLMLADIDFFAHRWPDALQLYLRADIDGLALPDRSLYSYRLALCQIRTGHFAEARKTLRNVKSKDFADIRNFYNAYLDYIGGDFKKAYEGFSKVTPGTPGLESGYYMLQIEYVWGRYSTVAAKADRMLHRNPVPELAPEIHRICGLSRFKLGEMDAAKISLDNYLDRTQGTPDNEALYALGVIDYERGDYSAAAGRFTDVTRADGALGQSAWLYLGQCRLQLGDIQGATLAFEKAAAYETDPKVAQTALYDYITALTRGGNVPFSKSAEMLEAYLRRWPDSPHVPQVEQYLASAYFNDRDYRKAVSCVDGIRNPSAQLLAIKQKALYQQGIVEATNGNYRESAGWFSRAAAMRSTDSRLAGQASLWLGDALYNEGKYREAADAYNAFLNGKPTLNKALGLYNLAYARYRLGDYAAAARDFAAAETATPHLATALLDDAQLRRADCLYYTGNYTDALALYDNARKGKADNDYAAYRHAMLSGLAHTPQQKINALEEFLRDYPQSKWCAAALLELAQTHEELGHSREAADAYRRRMAINPDADIDELISAAKAADAAGDHPLEQLQLLDRIAASNDLPAEQLYDISLYRANALARAGQDTDADDIYARLAANPENLAGATAAVTLANRLLEKRQYQKAFDLMNDFTETGTPHTYWLAKGFIALADACTGLGNKELAREYLISLRDNYPGNEPDILSAIESRLK